MLVINAAQSSAPPGVTIQVGQARFCCCHQAGQFGGLTCALLGCGKRANLASEIKGFTRRLDLPAADVVERFVVRKASSHHGFRHSVRHQHQSKDAGHFALATRSRCVCGSSNRPASVEKTRPMVTHNTSCVLNDISRNW